MFECQNTAGDSKSCFFFGPTQIIRPGPSRFDQLGMLSVAVDLDMDGNLTGQAPERMLWND